MTPEDELIEAIITAVKLLNVHRRRDLIYKLLNANVEEKIAPMNPSPLNFWVM